MPPTLLSLRPRSPAPGCGAVTHPRGGSRQPSAGHGRGRRRAWSPRGPFHNRAPVWWASRRVGRLARRAGSSGVQHPSSVRLARLGALTRMGVAALGVRCYALGDDATRCPPLHPHLSSGIFEPRPGVRGRRPLQCLGLIRWCRGANLGAGRGRRPGPAPGPRLSRRRPAMAGR